MSYSTFAISAITASPAGPITAGAPFNVTATISSSGPAGTAVVQIYFSQDPPTRYVRYQFALLCFAKVALPANAPPTPVVISCTTDNLMWYDEAANDYLLYPGSYTLYGGLSSAASELTKVTTTITVVPPAMAVPAVVA